jgi:hypothetical protein
MEMAKVGTFDVLKVMCERNMDIRLSTLDNVIQLRKVKKGTNITIGFHGDVVSAIALGKMIGGMLLVDNEQFKTVKKELEAVEFGADTNVRNSGKPEVR